MKNKRFRVGYYNPTFKQIFPTWETFYRFLIDYSVYYSSEVYTTNKVLTYYALLYRQFANSNVAYDYEVFLEKLSLIIAENFREFFKIRELLDHVNELSVDEMLQGIESITNVGQNPNITTDKNTILDYIGTQSRTRSTENIVDRVHTLVTKLKVNEVMREVIRYEDLFVQIPPSPMYFYYEDEFDEADLEYQDRGGDYD